MTKRMLIDAAHAEETRVVVVDGSRIEEFDFESRSKKQLRGNIYLAKVTRVEPSLQAAFIEYGGNRHGFLAFNEIHPDYYQIPTADREALLREEAEYEDSHSAGNGATVSTAGDGEETESDDDDDDVMEEEVARRRARLMRRYKIQDVIKRRQIMLVQVVKEERGNKGAALTTYLSLAGRYCVLMPNSPRGGGVSRKIVSATDRKRLKAVVQSLDAPQGMGLIVRTAGAKRTKAEIKRDYEYLTRLWENIRDVTLHSIAPALIYEEEDLVKRAIRDMYDKDLEGIVVEGEQGYRDAKEFMRMLMPSQAKKIQAYREPTPLFIKAKVEDHLSQIYSPTVPLRSGGYLVINQTEALVAIDVNSGRATRERNIEATALKTNLEAAEEAARQLRLRDLAGLIVIDFIDMDEPKNNRAVEKVLKDCLKDDRARIQMGKISSFGLMEISRQRRRSGVLEGTTHVCEHCQGMGRVRSVESSALSALRALEMEAVRGGPGTALLKVPTQVGLYILNEKRDTLLRLEQGQGLKVAVQFDEALLSADHEIQRLTTLSEDESKAFAAAAAAVSAPRPADLDDDDLVDEDEDDDEDEDLQAVLAASDEDEEGSPSPRPAAPEARDGDRSRRRRRRRGRRDEGPEPSTEPRAAAPAESQDRDDDNDDSEEGRARRRRRRGRRGGRRMREEQRPQETYAWTRVRVPHDDGVYTWFDPATIRTAAPVSTAATISETASVSASAAPATQDEEIYVWLPDETAAPKPARARRSRGRGRGEAAATDQVVTETAVTSEPLPTPAPESQAEAEPVTKPKRRTRVKAPPVLKVVSAEPAPAAVASPVDTPAAPVLTVAPEPASEPALVVAPSAPALPDPAEISTPPTAPKRGWWRRG